MSVGTCSEAAECRQLSWLMQRSPRPCPCGWSARLHVLLADLRWLVHRVNCSYNDVGLRKMLTPNYIAPSACMCTCVHACIAAFRWTACLLFLRQTVRKHASPVLGLCALRHSLLMCSCFPLMGSRRIFPQTLSEISTQAGTRRHVTAPPLAAARRDGAPAHWVRARGDGTSTGGLAWTCCHRRASVETRLNWCP